jgi:circadian clock protein KaiC
MVGDSVETKLMLTRLIDLLKTRQTTAMFTSLTSGPNDIEESEVGVSSLMDTWILVKNIEANGERNRGLYILKARGIAHSNQIREFVLTDHGVDLLDTYIGMDGVLMGTARVSQLAREAAAEGERRQLTLQRERELKRKQELYEAQVAALKGQFEVERDAILRELDEDRNREEVVATQRLEMARIRRADNLGIKVDENGARKARKGTVK